MTKQETIAKLREAQAKADAGEIYQIRGFYTGVRGSKVGYCAIGYPTRSGEEIISENDLGLTNQEVDKVISANDDSDMTFGQIADGLENGTL